MKKLEKLKLSEMQDFTAIEKDESATLKGGRWAANEAGWDTFLWINYRSNLINSYGSGSSVLSQGVRYYQEGTAIIANSQYSQNFVLGSHYTPSNGQWVYEVDTPDGVSGNYVKFYGSVFGDSSNCQNIL